MGCAWGPSSGSPSPGLACYLPSSLQPPNNHASLDAQTLVRRASLDAQTLVRRAPLDKRSGVEACTVSVQNWYILILYWNCLVLNLVLSFLCHNIILWQFADWFHLGDDSTKIRWTWKKKIKKSPTLSQLSRNNHSHFRAGTSCIFVLSARNILAKMHQKQKATV